MEQIKPDPRAEAQWVEETRPALRPALHLVAAGWSPLQHEEVACHSPFSCVTVKVAAVVAPCQVFVASRYVW